MVEDWRVCVCQRIISRGCKESSYKWAVRQVYQLGFYAIVLSQPCVVDYQAAVFQIPYFWIILELLP